MSNSFNLQDLKRIFIKLGIKKKDKLQVNSNILNILKSKKTIIKPNQIIDALIEIVTFKGSLMFPAYNWSFCNGEGFKYLETKSLTGALSNLALKRKDFLRSINPIYSLSIYGKDKNKISKLKHKSCFSLNSPFGYLIKNNGKNLFIDLDYKEALTYVHVAEESVKVNYRYLKKFSGTYFDINNKKKKKSFFMYVRKPEMVTATYIHKKFDNILKKNKALKTIKFKGHKFSIVDLKKTYQLMVSDLKNKGGMIYPNLINL